MERLKKALDEIRKMSAGGLALVVLATIAGFMADWHSLFDWFADFRLAYVLLPMVPLVLWLRHDRRVVGIAAATIGVNVAVLAPWASRPAESCEPDVVAIAINAFHKNSDHDVLITQLTAESADIVFVSELHGALKNRIAAIYPHHAWSSDAPRIALFSRHPISSVDLRRTAHDRPYYNALVETPGGPVRVLGAHTRAPFDERSSNNRNANIRELADIANNSAEPVILLGDLNVTMFSPHYAPLADAGLANVRRGRGVNATWPAFSPVIPIDHIAHSDDFRVCDVEVGESFASDHLPLRAGLVRVQKSVGAIASR